MARPVSAAERAWRLCRRNPIVSSLSALVLMLLLGGLAGLSIFNVQLTKANKEVTEQRDVADEAKNKAVQAHQAAETARASEAKARGEAENDVKAALTGLRVFVVETRNELKGRPNLTSLRERLSQAALTHIVKLSGTVGTRSVKDRSTAAAMVLLGDLFLELGRMQSAKENYERGFAMLEAIARADPADQAINHNLAVAYQKRAYVALQLDDARAARAMYEKALELRQDHLKRSPKSDDVRLGVAQAYGYLGNACLNVGDPQAALNSYHLAQKTYATVSPRRLQGLRQDLADLQRVLGKTYQQVGDVESARKHLNEALRGQVALVKQNRTAGAWQNVALTLCALGDLELMSNHNPFAAALYYREAAARLEPLVKLAPDVTSPKEDLAFADYRLGTACQRAALLSPGLTSVPWVAASRFHFDRARATLQPIARLDPRNSGVQIQLLFATARCGHRSEALSLADRLVSGWPKDQRVLYHAACGYALCVPIVDKKEAKQLSAKALQTLARAVAGGWKDAEELRRNPELDAVRDQPGFAELQKKADAARK